MSRSASTLWITGFVFVSYNLTHYFYPLLRSDITALSVKVCKPNFKVFIWQKFKVYLYSIAR